MCKEKIKGSIRSRDLVHISFELGLWIKATDGLLEILGGILLLYLNPSRMSGLAILLTRHELSEDPRDLVANALLRFSHSFSISSQYFGVFYLLSHGIIKFFLILLLWRKKLWAYPLTIASFILFAAYQIYRYSFSRSVSMLLLTAFDLVMIVLTFIEYKRMRSGSTAEHSRRNSSPH